MSGVVTPAKSRVFAIFCSSSSVSADLGCVGTTGADLLFFFKLSKQSYNIRVVFYKFQMLGTVMEGHPICVYLDS